MTATAIQTVAAVIQALAAVVFLGSVVWDARDRRRERERRAKLNEQERRDGIINVLFSAWMHSSPQGGMMPDEVSGIFSQRQIEYFNTRLKAMGENWTYPFERVDARQNAERTEMWWWRKVRRANISTALRDELERSGEAVLAHALAVPMDVPSSPLHKFRFEERKAAEEWLTEQRDIAERHRQIAETVEIAILVFVVFGVVLDFLILMQAIFERHFP
jgi:hypothetical protein